ncbi:gamma-glutamyltransferase [Gryllotalpicola koreensis]|uniref:Gamma-glutamyltransferase n=1 Tax=Gryllotalpicola koreensis TaxID=993086 RepID=A0ABP7ZSQ6_9MICO
MTVALAAPHHDAVAAGRQAAEAGGNALDAALAAAVMLTVVYPHQCAIGGDLIAVVRAPGGATHAVLAAGTAPAAVLTAAGGWSRVPRQGAHAVTVPGIVAGWTAIAGLGASRPLSGPFRGAARMAREGAVVSEGLARAIASEGDAVVADPGLSSVFLDGDGRPLGAGEIFRQPALAGTLDRLAADPADIYTGETARRLVAALRAAGGTHTEDDFAGYAPEVVPALTVDAAGRRWSVAPPPSAGVLVPAVVRAATSEEGAPVAALVGASLRGVAARGARLGDPRVSPVDIDALLALDGTAISAAREARASGDTAAIVAIDDAGWAVTIVQSVYMTFGAGLLDPASGVLVHNRASAFVMDPASPARLAPGARPPHTLSPLIVEDGETVLVAGCQGGRAQPWILSQLLAAPGSLHAPLDELLARPRWVVGDVDLGFDQLTLVSEPGADPAAAIAAAAAGIRVAAFDGPADEAGHVQFVRIDASGGVAAASDPRADGAGIIVPTPKQEEQS